MNAFGMLGADGRQGRTAVPVSSSVVRQGRSR